VGRAEKEEREVENILGNQIALLTIVQHPEFPRNQRDRALAYSASSVTMKPDY
jgi:hypothetical protein